MLVGIISDTHGSPDTMAVLRYLKERGVTVILHAGDVAGEKGENLEEIISSLSAFEKSYLAFGNCDMECCDNIMEICTEKGVECGLLVPADIDGYMVHVSHHAREARDAALSGKYELVIYGHAHLYHTASKGDPHCTVVNPGAIDDDEPTCAIWDTSHFSIEKVELGSLLGRRVS